LGRPATGDRRQTVGLLAPDLPARPTWTCGWRPRSVLVLVAGG